jgi:hypothetical protein
MAPSTPGHAGNDLSLRATLREVLATPAPVTCGTRSRFALQQVERQQALQADVRRLQTNAIEPRTMNALAPDHRAKTMPVSVFAEARPS